MSYDTKDSLEKVTAIAIVRRDIRNNLSSTQIKAKLLEKFGDSRKVELIYYRALEKENVTYELFSN